jgi:uncharacterized repeat protein (TIGR03809 family)
MTHQMDVARGRDIVARWCALAEKRLDYLTELFETGRWRRYHSELAFLENIQEAKTAVETWRRLSMREASLDNTSIDLSWLGRRSGTAPSRGETRRDEVHLQPQPAAIAAEALPSAISIVPEPDPGYANEAVPSPAIDDDVAELMRDPTTIAERYPLLHNAL